ncbi:MAG: caspase family protein [Desulfobacteraceae bacterium]|jgi:hypothetical protein
MSQSFVNGYALLIGVDENAIPRWSLPDVKKDIDALRAVLTRPERCAYPQEHVKTLTGRSATRDNILDGLGWLREKLTAEKSANATAVVYYSGHGWRDESRDPPDYHLIPYNVSEYQLQSRALRASDFAHEINQLETQRLLVLLDCCHAAGMGVKGLSPAGYVPAALPPQLFMGKAQAVAASDGSKGLEALASGAGRAVISSSQAHQQSYIRKDGKMSIFTYHLIEALTGHAQAEENAAEVLVTDVMSHVYRHVPESAAADRQREQVPDYQLSGNFPVALLLGGKGLPQGAAPPDPLAPVTSGPVAVGGGDAVDLRGSRGATYFDQKGQKVKHQTNIGTVSGGIFQPGMTVHGDLHQAARDLVVSLRKVGVAEKPSDIKSLKRALAVLKSLDTDGRLAAKDEWMIAELKRLIANSD